MCLAFISSLPHLIFVVDSTPLYKEFKTLPSYKTHDQPFAYNLDYNFGILMVIADTCIIVLSKNEKLVFPHFF